MSKPEVAALYLWLEGCQPAWLADAAALEALVREAAAAGSFTLFHAASGAAGERAWALAVVGESHLVLHASRADGSLTAEVVSCSTLEAAERALELVRRRVPHARAARRGSLYRRGRLTPVPASRG